MTEVFVEVDAMTALAALINQFIFYSVQLLDLLFGESFSFFEEDADEDDRGYDNHGVDEPHVAISCRV